MQIKTIAQIVIHAKVEAVFDASIDCQNLPRFFTGHRPIPAIVSARTVDGLPLHPGSVRIVENSDGSLIEEIIVALDRPTQQSYQLVRGFKPPFSWLVRAASGEWIYESLESQSGLLSTRVTWRFCFEISNVLAYFVFRFAVQRSFQTAQVICLNNLKNDLEKAHQASRIT
jgi:hypothetical protein